MEDWKVTYAGRGQWEVVNDFGRTGNIRLTWAEYAFLKGVEVLWRVRLNTEKKP